MAYDPLNNVEDLAIAGQSLVDELDITTHNGFETLLEVRRTLRSWLLFALVMLVAAAPFAMTVPDDEVVPPLAECLMSHHRSALSLGEPALCMDTDRLPTPDEVQAYYRNRRVEAATPGPWDARIPGKLRLALDYQPPELAALPLDGGRWLGLSTAATVVAHQRAFPTSWQRGREATEAEMDAKVEARAVFLVEHLGLERMAPIVYQWARDDLGLLSEEDAAVVAAEVGALHAQIATYQTEVAPLRAQAEARQLLASRIRWARFGGVVGWVFGFVWLCRARVVNVRREGDMLYVDGTALSLDTGVAAHAEGPVVRLIEDQRVVWELRPELWDAERCAALAYLINQPAMAGRR